MRQTWFAKNIYSYTCNWSISPSLDEYYCHSFICIPYWSALSINYLVYSDLPHDCKPVPVCGGKTRIHCAENFSHKVQVCFILQTLILHQLFVFDKYARMTSFGAKIREKMNRMSGDSSVTNKEAMGNNGSDWHCDSCKRSWAEDDKSKPDLVEYCACQEWFCQNCSQLKKKDMNALNRDMFWACRNCLATVKIRVVEKNKYSEPNKDITTKITEAINEHMKTFETRLDKRIEQAVSVEVPKADEACTKKAIEGIDNSVTTCLEKVGEE